MKNVIFAIKVTWNNFKFCVICTSIFLYGCSDSGVQGSNLYSKFQGLSAATALSPTAVKLTWGLDAKYTEYRIYENDAVTPKTTETFGNATMSNLLPSTTYNYLISGYSASGGENFVGSKTSVTTLDHFDGITAGGVTIKSVSEIKLSWVMNSPSTRFNIYYKLQSGTWNLSLPTASIENGNQYTVGSLTAGQTYCFFIKAEYLDGTTEPAASTESEINAVAQCQQLTSPMASLPTVNISSVVFGDFPWFWTANGDNTYKTDIYDLATNTRVASRTGNGYFRSTVSMAQSNKSFYALVSNAANNVSRVSVDNIGSSVATTSSVRKMNSSGSKGPIYPPILSNGAGSQNMGNQIVSGDFNCDGLPDIAVASKTSVPFATPERYSGIGSVTIYYTHEFVENDINGNPVTRYELKTDVTPSSTASAPNPQLISYSVGQKDAQIGSKLVVGNFNGDCVQKNYDPLAPNGSPARGNCDYIYTHFSSPTAAVIRNTKKCDDLAIASTGGFLYIVYGDPSIGLVSGSMSNTAGYNEQTCDAVSSTCRASQYSVPATYVASSFGRALAAGDFNNDGFDDLAVSSTVSVTGVDDILVYRGDSLGLYPNGHANSFANITPGSGVPAGVAAGNGFGFSLTAVPNSRLCVNNSPVSTVYRTLFPSTYPSTGLPPGSNGLTQNSNGIDVTKCADLVIGAPNKAHGSNTGSIYSCRATQPTTGDTQKITAWTCDEHYPNSIAGELVSQYGYSLLGVANQNGYPVATNVLGASLAARTPSLWGTLFVGAPTSTIDSSPSVGSVYGYYVTKTNGDSYLKGIQTVLPSGAHTVTADNFVPCDSANDICGIQRIYPAPAQSGMLFGYVLSSVSEKAGNDDSWMPILAVSAPYRDNVNSSGQLVTDSGSVYLYRGDISTFMNKMDGGIEITQPKYNPLKLSPCSNGSCTWLSGGISPFGATIIYNSAVSNYANFGLGGAAGFNSLSDNSFNDDKQTDLFVTAPNNNFPTTANGGVYGYYSSAGSFNSTVTAPNLSIERNQSLEGNYKFEEAKVVGDLNGDGYADVMSHISNNNQWVVAIYYGSSAGLIQSPAPSFTAVGMQPKLFKSVADPKLGEQFFKAGDLNGDGYADVLILSSNGLGSYIYYGSADGLVTGVEPNISPIGKNPLRFGLSGSNTVSFSPWMTSYDASGVGIVDSYNNDVQSVTYGKFNNDIYDDIAIRVRTTSTLPASLRNGSLDYAGTGRVYIIYGGANGPKTNTNTGKILLQDVGGNPADVVTTNPCDALDNSNCKIQMLVSPDPSALLFGFGLSRRSMYNTTLSEYDGLLISDPAYNTSTGRVYVYKGDLRGLNPVPIQKLVPRDTGTYFGYTIVEAGDINGDLTNDIAISSYVKPASSTRAQVITVFYGKQVGSSMAYGGAATNSLADISYWTPVVNDNRDLSGYQPQVLNPVTSVTADRFGFGMTGLGDFNHDGYADIAVNVSNGDYNISGTVSKTGYVLIFFGSSTGLQINSSNVTPTPYPRCYRGLSPICDPYQIYLPNYTANDFTHLNRDSVGDINGDGLPDLIIGAAGRSHPSGLAISTGVIYVLY